MGNKLRNKQTHIYVQNQKEQNQKMKELDLTLHFYKNNKAFALGGI